MSGAVGGGGGGGGAPPYTSSGGSGSGGGGSDTESDQVSKLMELQHQQAAAAGLGGGYGLYGRNPYGGQGGGSGGDSPVGAGFGGPRGHLGGYPFPPMPGQNSYGGYHHLGYPGSQSPGRDGKDKSIMIYDWEIWGPRKMRGGDSDELASLNADKNNRLSSNFFRPSCKQKMSVKGNIVMMMFEFRSDLASRK